MSRASDALAIVRGDVRDGVAAIDHFLQVLASRRVGPRMLAKAVPEMAQGCAPLHAALGVLADALGVELAGDPEGLTAVRALIAHADGRVAELSAALAAHAGGTMEARERLGLEAVVRRVSNDLGPLVGLVDLLGAPVTSETTTIDLADALAGRRVVAGAGTTPVRATVEQRPSELVVGDARLVLELLAHAVATAVRAGVTAPRVVVEIGPEGVPTFTVEAGASPPPVGAPVFEIAMRDELPHEAEVVRAAARHAGITLTVSEGGRKVTIAL